MVLGIPYDINTDGLRQYMSTYGSLDDVVVMKERKSGRSRGFGYVTFSSTESAEKALASKHILNGRLLEVKVATPKEDTKTPSTNITRIFVARIPSKVSEDAFKRYFEKFGTITDIYMPKDRGAKSHRGIGFITFEKPESVVKVMAETHEIGGATVAVDEATPKDEGGKSSSKQDYAEKDYAGAYGAYAPYIAAGRGGPQFGAYGMSPFGAYDYNRSGLARDFGPTALSGGYGGSSWHQSAGPGFGGPQASSGVDLANKVFVGKLPSEATSESLRQYFGNFGRVLDVYLPKDSSRGGHRGFAFVSFADKGPAERVCRRPHELLGHQVIVEHASPAHEAGLRDRFQGVGSVMPLSAAEAAGSAYPGSSYRSSFDDYNGDHGAKSYRGTGFASFEKPGSVKAMAETHEISRSTVGLDEATPKDEGGKSSIKDDYAGKYYDKDYTSAYGAYTPYVAARSAGSQLGAYGMSPFGANDRMGSELPSDFGPSGLAGGFGGSNWRQSSAFGSGGTQAPSGAGVANKIFVGRLPSEATSESLRQYFGNFGRILDVYLPKDSNRKDHRGFAFVTFADRGPAERVCCRSHELLGHQVVVERASAPDEAELGDGHQGGGSGMVLSPAGATGSAYPGSSYRSSRDNPNGWGVAYGGAGPILAGDGGSRESRMDLRYRPY